MNIKEEDRKPLEIGKEGREFLRQDVHVFKMNWLSHQHVRHWLGAWDREGTKSRNRGAGRVRVGPTEF